MRRTIAGLTALLVFLAVLSSGDADEQAAAERSGTAAGQAAGGKRGFTCVQTSMFNFGTYCMFSAISYPNNCGDPTGSTMCQWDGPCDTPAPQTCPNCLSRSKDSREEFRDSIKGLGDTPIKFNSDQHKAENDEYARLQLPKFTTISDGDYVLFQATTQKQTKPRDVKARILLLTFTNSITNKNEHYRIGYEIDEFPTFVNPKKNVNMTGDDPNSGGRIVKLNSVAGHPHEYIVRICEKL